MNRELSAALRSLDHLAISDKAAELKIRWKFNPPTALHMEGAWEKLIRSVKTALTWVLKNRNLKEEVLHTFLVFTFPLKLCLQITIGYVLFFYFFKLFSDVKILEKSKSFLRICT